MGMSPCALRVSGEDQGKADVLERPPLTWRHLSPGKNGLGPLRRKKSYPFSLRIWPFLPYL